MSESPSSQLPVWTDSQLAAAIAESTNWRSVMRLLGFGDRSRSAGAIRIVRRRATALGLDWSHFRGSAAGRMRSSTAAHQEPRGPAWPGHRPPQRDRAHRPSAAGRYAADRLGRHRPEAPADGWPGHRCRLVHASGLCGLSPIEPAAYDLLADSPDGISRVQVKTTTFASHSGWMATVGHHPDNHSKKGQLQAYDPDEIDLFFIIDGDMTMYLIPYRAVAGRVRVLLRTYRKYIVGNAHGLLGSSPGAEEQPLVSA
jgi:hypothetical protein